MNATNSVNIFVISTAVLSNITSVSCVSVIEQHFNKETGITVNVNFVTKKVKFSYDANLWDKTKIKKVMSRLGYNIANFATAVNS